MGITLYLESLDGGSYVELHSSFQSIIITDILRIFSADVHKDGSCIFASCIETEKLVPLSLLEDWLNRVEQQLKSSHEWVYSIWRSLPNGYDVGDVGYVCVDKNYWMIEATFNRIKVRALSEDEALERQKRDGAVIVYPLPEKLPPLFEDMDLYLSDQEFNEIFSGTPLHLKRNRIRDEFHDEFEGIRRLIQSIKKEDKILVRSLAA